MKPLFVSSLFAFALAACLDTPVEPPAPAPTDSTQVDDRTASDRPDGAAFDNSVFYCIEAWENEGLCLQISSWTYLAHDNCVHQCESYGYVNPHCGRGPMYEVCN